jgi:hypothetical protein
MLYLPKNEDGIKQILTNLNKLKDKNLAYYRGTFRFFVNQHPPFENSLIYYNVVENSFQFISKSKIRAPIYVWNKYVGESTPCYLKEYLFMHSNASPFNIIVSGADFLLKGFDDNLAELFHNKMTETVSLEILSWRLKLSEMNNVNIKPLF